MSIRIFGSGGGLITDATAEPDDVINGKIFYNNDGRQIGTCMSRKIQSQISVCEEGFYAPVSWGSQSIRLVNRPSSKGDNYILTEEMTSSNSANCGWPTRGVLSYAPFYAVTVNTPILDVESIKVGSYGYILGTDGGTSDGNSNNTKEWGVRSSVSDGISIVKTSTSSSGIDTSLCFGIAFGAVYGHTNYYIKSVALLALVNGQYASYAGIRTANIPITINRYVD